QRAHDDLAAQRGASRKCDMEISDDRPGREREVLGIGRKRRDPAPPPMSIDADFDRALTRSYDGARSTRLPGSDRDSSLEIRHAGLPSGERVTHFEGLDRPRETAAHQEGQHVAD